MPPLLFIHGACSSGAIWVRQRRHYPEARFPTLPAFEGPASDLIDAGADWLHSSMADPHVVVGHSLGGAVALRLARKYPEDVLSLVLVGTAPNLAVSPRLLQRLQDQPEEALADIAEWSFSESAALSLKEASRRQIQKVPATQALREFQAANTFNAEGWLDQIAAPLAVVVGEDDLMTPPTLVRNFLRVWPKVPYYEMAHAGHLVMIEKSREFNSLLDDILGAAITSESSVETEFGCD